ncbi:Protein CBG26864 [Caenorhabditis briggsae]|uniref:Protein CBG26864 n=1 Tax=Caenorhabditis briggsae TaxID=6238 RepID=B6II64_CAEBR|nr:Protein CBG26864 [Caenorhabditis briggsae]CAR99594.1 Protein CBG26864 [Caenorhabditis briggsae]
MSLLPLNTLSEAGCLFIEARLLGGPGNIVSQIGLTVDAPNTSIAVFYFKDLLIGVHFGLLFGPRNPSFWDFLLDFFPYFFLYQMSNLVE